ncbi:MAG: hypothetical protein HY905_27375 [Deltaproteobacteria bacterium]|nr:hypothetical protein [Deltaproteobacteria bacterium]
MARTATELRNTEGGAVACSDLLGSIDTVANEWDGGSCEFDSVAARLAAFSACDRSAVVSAAASRFRDGTEGQRLVSASLLSETGLYTDDITPLVEGMGLWRSPEALGIASADELWANRLDAWLVAAVVGTDLFCRDPNVAFLAVGVPGFCDSGEEVRFDGPEAVEPRCGSVEGAAASPVVPVLGRIVDVDSTWGGVARRGALLGLCVLGGETALAAVDEARRSWSTWRSPWLPLPRRVRAAERRRQLGGVGDSCRVEPADALEGMWVSDDGDEVRAGLDYGLAEARTLWIAERHGDVWEYLVADGGEASECVEVRRIGRVDDGVVVTLGQRAAKAESCLYLLVGRAGSTFAVGPGGRLADGLVISLQDPGGEARATYAWADLRADSDGDGWTDRAEEQIGTDPGDDDTDDDGIVDSMDAAPQGSRTTEDGCSCGGALDAALFAHAGLQDPLEPTFLLGLDNTDLQFHGFAAPVVRRGRWSAGFDLADRGWEGAYLHFLHLRVVASSGGADEEPCDGRELFSDGTLAGVTIEERPNDFQEGWTTVYVECIRDRRYPTASTVMATF